MDRLKDNVYPCLTTEQMERYLAQRSTREETIQIERHILECHDCHDALDGYQENPAAGAILQQMDREADLMFDAPVSRPVIIRQMYPWAAAAAIVVLLISGGIVYYNSQWHIRLYDSYFTSYENFHYFTYRGEAEWTDETANLEAEAFYLYDLGRFHESIHAFNQWLTAEPEHTIAWFYAGMALMETGQFEEAIEYLGKVRYNDESLYAEATYYMALCYLRLSNTDSAVTLLSEIRPDDQPYGPKAAELLKALPR